MWISFVVLPLVSLGRFSATRQETTWISQLKTIRPAANRKHERKTIAVCRFDSSQELKAKSQKLFHRRDTLAQTRLVARSGVLVQQTLLNALVERGYRLAVGLLGGSFVAFFDGLAQITQLSTQCGCVGAVAHGAAFGLARTLQRRKMICHSWFLPFVCTARYSG